MRESWLVDPLVSALTSKFLDRTDSIFYGETKQTYTSEAQITIALTLEIGTFLPTSLVNGGVLLTVKVAGPGGKAQKLHRDDKNYHPDYKDQRITGYQLGSDVMMGFMISGISTTRENGATFAIPGSHL